MVDLSNRRVSRSHRRPNSVHAPCSFNSEFHVPSRFVLAVTANEREQSVVQTQTVATPIREMPPGMHLCCEEPFRIFFPAGAILGLVGVSLWPLFYLGTGIAYPNITHARLMIEGFLACFVFGFLGTAGPRLTSARHFSITELGILFSLQLFAAGLHLGQANRLGDFVFALSLLFFVRTIGIRFRERKDSPPPNFVLVGLGLFSGIVGASLTAWSENAQYSGAYQVGTSLLNECFILLPVLGIAPFFIGRLLDLPSSDAPESRAFPPEWRRRAAFALAIGLTVIASFIVDTFALHILGGVIRVIAIGVYLAVRLPLRGRTFLADCLRIGLLGIVTGFGVMALFPIYRVGALHIVFIAGFSFLVFTVATRVIFGHSGNLARVRSRMPFFVITTILLFVAMISRFTADLSPKVRTVHLVAGAICWLAAALIWMARAIPKTRLVEAED